MYIVQDVIVWWWYYVNANKASILFAKISHLKKSIFVEAKAFFLSKNDLKATKFKQKQIKKSRFFFKKTTFTIPNYMHVFIVVNNWGCLFMVPASDGRCR
jgi:hypothetical protein